MTAPGLIQAAKAFLDDWFEGRPLNGAALNHALHEVDRQELVVVSRKLVEEAANSLEGWYDHPTDASISYQETCALAARLRRACAGEGGV